MRIRVRRGPLLGLCVAVGAMTAAQPTYRAVYYPPIRWLSRAASPKARRDYSTFRLTFCLFSQSRLKAWQPPWPHFRILRTVSHPRQ